MIFIAVAYIVVATLLFVLVSTRLAHWATRMGINGPESTAKAVAMTWRFAEVALAALILYVLWFPILHFGAHGPWSVEGGGLTMFFATAYTLLFGGLYVVASLVSAITVPLGNQVAYFRTMDAKMKRI